MEVWSTRGRQNFLDLGGIRTHDPGFWSPMACHRSYKARWCQTLTDHGLLNGNWRLWRWEGYLKFCAAQHRLHKIYSAYHERRTTKKEVWSVPNGSDDFRNFSTQVGCSKHWSTNLLNVIFNNVHDVQTIVYSPLSSNQAELHLSCETLKFQLARKKLLVKSC